MVAESPTEAATALRENDPRRVFTHTVVSENPEITFMFPGGGAQYAGMARDLYETEPVFADWMDRGLDILAPKLDFDIRALWLPEPGNEDAANERLKTPSERVPYEFEDELGCVGREPELLELELELECQGKSLLNPSQMNAGFPRCVISDRLANGT